LSIDEALEYYVCIKYSMHDEICINKTKKQLLGPTSGVHLFACHCRNWSNVQNCQYLWSCTGNWFTVYS